MDISQRGKSQRFSVRNLSDVLGAELIGVDLSQPLDDESFRKVLDLFHERSVLVFRDQRITEPQHIAFSRRFGELEEIKRSPYLKPGYPEILVISNVIEDGKQIGLMDAGVHWHTDLSYTKVPSRASLLYGIEIPEKNGEPLGDTLFVSTSAAYDALPEDLKRRLGSLKAINRSPFGYDGKRFNKGAKHEQGGRVALAALTEDELTQLPPDAVHPVVCTHPFTGRKVLFVNESATVSIVGMDKHESDDLLTQLIAHVKKPEYMYRHRWRRGDLLMWDNFATQHLAVCDYELPQRRRMQRTTLKGSVPV